MIKWLCEIVYAFLIKKQLSISFRSALRFVRRDLLTQQEIDKFIKGYEDPKKGD